MRLEDLYPSPDIINVTRETHFEKLKNMASRCRIHQTLKESTNVKIWSLHGLVLISFS